MRIFAEATLKSEADRHAARRNNILLHDRLEQRDHRGNVAFVNDRLRRRAVRIGDRDWVSVGIDLVHIAPGATFAVHRIGELTREVIVGRGKHFGAEVDSAKAGRKMELRRCQQLNTVC